MESYSETLAPSNRGRFLDHFEPARRSLIANIFFAAIRGGCTRPRDILAEVTRDAGQRGDQTRLLLVLTDDVEGAVRFAESCMAWEALPREERDRRKAQRGQEFQRESMTGKPATDKQLAYLRKLGHVGQVTDRRHASELIDQLAARKSSAA